MTLEELKKELKNAKSIMLKKQKNNFGNYVFQGWNLKTNKSIIGCFNNYEDAITFFYFEGFTNEKHLEKSIIMEK